MSPEILTTLAAAFTTLSGGSVAWFWYVKKRDDKHVDQMNVKIDSNHKDLSNKIESIKRQQTEHENKFITETRTRELLQEYLHILEQKQTEMNSDVKDIKEMFVNLSTELKIINALKAYEDKNKQSRGD